MTWEIWNQIPLLPQIYHVEWESRGISLPQFSTWQMWLTLPFVPNIFRLQFLNAMFSPAAPAPTATGAREVSGSWEKAGDGCVPAWAEPWGALPCVMHQALYLLEAFLLCVSHSCLRCKKPSIWAEGISWVLAGRVAAVWAWTPLLALRSDVGEGTGLDSLELVLCSAAPLTISLVSAVSAT